MKDIKKEVVKQEIEQGMVKVVEDARRILGYVPPKPMDDDPTWDNDEHYRDNEIREREREIASAESIMEDR